MSRFVILALLACCLGAGALAANVTIVINGKALSVPVIVQNGKTYLDFGALLKALGSMGSYDAAAKKLTITSGAGAAGTAQLAGDNGEFGKVYSLRQRDPLFFSLLKAEFTVNPVVIGNMLFVPRADEKLLVLRYSVQNPAKTDKLIRGDSLRFIAVDALDVNHTGVGHWGDAITGQSVGLLLKPAQKLEMFTVIKVPAKGVVPKLMMQSNLDNDGPVLRYDLRGKVTPLPAPIADPADTTGATALEEVPASLNVACPMTNYSMRVEKIALTTDPLDTPLKPGERVLALTLTLKYHQTFNGTLRYDSLQATGISTDGEGLRYKGLYLATANRPAGNPIKPGAESTVRACFVVPKDVTPKTIEIKEGPSRLYIFEVPAE